MERQNKVANLVSWACYSVFIPALAVFLRWLGCLFLGGPDEADPFDMLTSSEVVLVAAVIIAETLVKTPRPERSSSSRPILIVIQALLMILLVLSLAVFGLCAPLDTPPSVLTQVWVKTPEGRDFLAWFNLGLFVFVLFVILVTRWFYLTVDQTHLSDDVTPHAEPKKGLPQHNAQSMSTLVNIDSEE